MDDKVNLGAKLASFEDRYAPKIIGTYNDSNIQVCKAEGEFVWHSHDDTDDFFLVLRGRLMIDLPHRSIELGPGELFVVPRGMEHRPRATEETHVLLIEPKDTVNTGDVQSGLTVEEEQI